MRAGLGHPQGQSGRRGEEVHLTRSEYSTSLSHEEQSPLPAMGGFIKIEDGMEDRLECGALPPSPGEETSCIVDSCAQSPVPGTIFCASHMFMKCCADGCSRAAKKGGYCLAHTYTIGGHRQAVRPRADMTIGSRMPLYHPQEAHPRDWPAMRRPLQPHYIVTGGSGSMPDYTPRPYRHQQPQEALQYYHHGDVPPRGPAFYPRGLADTAWAKSRYAMQAGDHLDGAYAAASAASAASSSYSTGRLTEAHLHRHTAKYEQQNNPRQSMSDYGSSQDIHRDYRRKSASFDLSSDGGGPSEAASRRARQGRKCKVPDCDKKVRSRGLCKSHGGGKRCSVKGCEKSVQGGTLCMSHGGGKRCSFEGCQKSAQSRGKCKAHGGGERCRYDGCTKSSQGGGFCRAHGGGKRCTYPGCVKGTQRGDFCARHGGTRVCLHVGCQKVDRGGGYCNEHGEGRRCQVLACSKLARYGGACLDHFNHLHPTLKLVDFLKKSSSRDSASSQSSSGLEDG